jgi:hypothetical protein
MKSGICDANPHPEEFQRFEIVIASGAKQSMAPQKEEWIASLRSQ